MVNLYHINVLHQWAGFRFKKKSPAWSLISLFINTHRLLATERYSESASIADNLNKLYKKDGNWEPFLFDFSRHPSLARAREEKYSDYLKWLLDRLFTEVDLVHEILSEMLRISDEDILSKCQGKKPRIEREINVPKGHEGQAGRIDLLILFDNVVIDIEIKIVDAEFADLAKNKGYRESIETIYPEKTYTHRHRLLVTDSIYDYDQNDKSIPIKQQYHVLRWKDICLFLRRVCFSHNVFKNDNLFLGNILSFVGSIEQLLLGYMNLTKERFIDDRSFQYLKLLSKTLLSEGDNSNGR